MGPDDDSARVRRAELLLDYIGKKVREQLPEKDAEKTGEKANGV